MKAALAASTTWWRAGSTAISAPGWSVIAVTLTAVVAAITRAAAAAVVARAVHNSSGVRGRPMEKFCTRPSGL